MAVEEYRWQTEYNGKRSQFLLALTLGIAVFGATVAITAPAAACVVLGLGSLAAITGIIATRQMHLYYRAARDRVKRMETEAGIPQTWRIDTTTGMGGPSRRVSVTQLVHFLFAIIAVGQWTMIGAIALGRLSS